MLSESGNSVSFVHAYSSRQPPFGGGADVVPCGCDQQLRGRGLQSNSAS